MQTNRAVVRSYSMSNPASIKSAIRQAALGLGFSECRFASAEPFDTEADYFDAWVAKGSHGTMKWLGRNSEKRRDVRNIFPNAKSIVALAINYYDSAAQPEKNKISRYAWGSDYHELVEAKLRQLLDWIKAEYSAEGRYYVDTGPLLEKPIAQRAGIGWIGKHTNIITRDFGSWVFLAEILISLDLPPDAPAADLCGTCRKCIDACPTDAITAPYQLDANRCISYVTIELKPTEEIDPNIANKMNEWLYGCDVCQDVCPWNRFETPTAETEFAPRIENIGLDDETIEKMEQEEFSKRFKRSPVKRTKLAGLKRNLNALRGRSENNRNDYEPNESLAHNPERQTSKPSPA